MESLPCHACFRNLSFSYSIAVMAMKYSKPVQVEDDDSLSSMLHLVISTSGYNYHVAECTCTDYHPPQLFEPAVLQYNIPEQVNEDCMESKQLLVGPLVNYEFVCLFQHTHHLNNHASSGHSHAPHQCTDQCTMMHMVRNTLQYTTPRLTHTKAKPLSHYQYNGGTENNQPGQA